MSGQEAEPERPAHHGPDGRFRIPWLRGPAPPRTRADLLKWMWERLGSDRAPDPPPGELPRAEPALAEPGVAPDAGEARITWIGHASFLVQLPGATVLTDPVFSRRASPVTWAGPKRLSAPGLTVDALPRVDAVLLSHDHYDHLDRPSVRALHGRYGDDLVWFAPLGYEHWLGRQAIERVVSLDWWDEAELRGTAGVARVRCLPAQHWTRRALLDTNRRLWASWSVRAGGQRVYFGGDSGYCPAFREIGERSGPFDVALLPVGAYEPRWFMKPSHMNPEEAAQACRDVRARRMVAMHWGTFRLTDEPPLEPPARTRRAWADLGLRAGDLHVPAIGETLRFTGPGGP